MLPLSKVQNITSRLFFSTTLLVLALRVDAQRSSTTYSPSRCVSDTTAALALTSDVATVDSVAPGISYRCMYDRRGPWALHVVSIDLKADRYAIEGARALGARLGREKVSDMMRRTADNEPLIAINADFFNLRTGEVENNTVIAGEWVKGVLRSDSPHDQFDNAHTQFAIDIRGRPLFGRFELDAVVRVGDAEQRVLGINFRPPGDSGLVLYTAWYGTPTPRDSTTERAVEIALEPLANGNDTTYRVREGSLTSGGGLAVPRGGVVLSGAGQAAEFVRGLARGRSTVHIRARLGKHAVPPRTVVGGWPRLIVDSANVGVKADSLEGTLPRFSAARHPRSAIAITRDSSTLMLVVVDGRRPWSVGMSLGELADRLLALGAYQAMNLDGGGSSTLWVRGTIVNYPSDAAGERAVANALTVVRRNR